MNEAAEAVVAANLTGARFFSPLVALGWPVSERMVRALPVVAIDADPEDETDALLSKARRG